MRNILKPLACVSLLTLMSACATPDDGYYDKNGNWIPYNRYNREAHDHSPLPGGVDDSYDHYRGDATRSTTVTTTYYYDRPGYYNESGYYTTMDGYKVPPEMFPSRGMCRIWFLDRPSSQQPPVESCSGIRDRVPSGAYVIYGG